MQILVGVGGVGSPCGMKAIRILCCNSCQLPAIPLGCAPESLVPNHVCYRFAVLDYLPADVVAAVCCILVRSFCSGDSDWFDLDTLQYSDHPYQLQPDDSQRIHGIDRLVPARPQDQVRTNDMALGMIMALLRLLGSHWRDCCCSAMGSAAVVAPSVLGPNHRSVHTKAYTHGMNVGAYAS